MAETVLEIYEKKNPNKKAPREAIQASKDYLNNLIRIIMNVQSNTHLETYDWNRTVYIDVHDVNGMNFNMAQMDKQNLMKYGQQGVTDYFTWYDSVNKTPTT